MYWYGENAEIAKVIDDWKGTEKCKLILHILNWYC